MEEKILNVIESIIGKQLYKPFSEIEADVDLFEYGLDSIGFISLIVALEDEYNIYIDEDDLDLDKFNSKNYIVQYILNKIER